MSEIHHSSCPGREHGCTLYSGGGPRIARARGWGVGSVLEGDEGDGPTQIVILYLGEDLIVARDIVDPRAHEATWILSARCWGAVR